MDKARTTPVVEDGVKRKGHVETLERAYAFGSDVQNQPKEFKISSLMTYAEQTGRLENGNLKRLVLGYTHKLSKLSELILSSGIDSTNSEAVLNFLEELANEKFSPSETNNNLSNQENIENKELISEKILAAQETIADLVKIRTPLEKVDLDTLNPQFIVDELLIRKFQQKYPNYEKQSKIKNLQSQKSQLQNQLEAITNSNIATEILNSEYYKTTIENIIKLVDREYKLLTLRGIDGKKSIGDSAAMALLERLANYLKEISVSYNTRILDGSTDLAAGSIKLNSRVFTAVSNAMTEFRETLKRTTESLEIENTEKLEQIKSQITSVDSQIKELNAIPDISEIVDRETDYRIAQQTDEIAIKGTTQIKEIMEGNKATFRLEFSDLKKSSQNSYPTMLAYLQCMNNLDEKTDTKLRDSLTERDVLIFAITKLHNFMATNRNASDNEKLELFKNEVENGIQFYEN